MPPTGPGPDDGLVPRAADRSRVRWPRGSTDVVELPSGALVRGRRLADDRGPADFTLVLGAGPAPVWPPRRLRWPDVWVPLDHHDAVDALEDAYARG